MDEVFRMKALEIRDVSFRYPIGKDFVLKNISFCVDHGEFLAVVGANGGGKTTLCNILRGFIPEFQNGCDFSGEVLINGRKISDYSSGDLAREVGFVFQNPFIQISGVKKTVFEEIAFGLENLGTPKEEMRKSVTDIIELLRIGDLKDKHPAELSGGQRQRVALASVLVMNPDILIIDEPTSQLDPRGTQEIFDIIRIMKEQNKTIILVEHKIDLISEYADRVILLNDKGILIDDTVDAVLSDKILLSNGVPMPEIAEVADMYLQSKEKKTDRLPINMEQGIRFFRDNMGEVS
ncbi:ABC transporter ATP-binding protein [Marispirochaeta aestuarii]|uniref:energy-coupling factor ABC transporter ATP-binding protein n=1 Tax=Marispirochaeta aestuarii TaxID=1963862 RepID=UPI0029C8CB3E|nr:ABC transporter ATP-binding protein [Marispirochaeta aestuarii]